MRVRGLRAVSAGSLGCHSVAAVLAAWRRGQRTHSQRGRVCDSSGRAVGGPSSWGVPPAAMVNVLHIREFFWSAAARLAQMPGAVAMVDV